ncbi:cytoskeleton-associated protein [Aureococcus anophagefferens]|uniref:Cytoskeleton-associated protein n=1 Tax=Aureococcus anophagefferens TaxID=44056 RepID=A0ABR1FH77_AURAN
MGINNHQMRGVKDWVTARDDEQWSLLPEGMVAVNVSHSNLSQKMLELRFDLHQTVGEVKARLHLHHGTPADMQRLTLRDGGVDLCAMDDDSKMLASTAWRPAWRSSSRVDPHSISRNGALENTDLVDKYRMDDETYEARKGTVREWIKEQKAADPNWKPPKPNGATNFANAKTAALPADVPTDADAAHVVLGGRCERARFRASKWPWAQQPRNWSTWSL